MKTGEVISKHDFPEQALTKNEGVCLNLYKQLCQ